MIQSVGFWWKKIRKPELSTVSSFTGSDTSLFSEGDTVQHERFGNGKIITIEGQPPNTTATVDFEKDGRKKLLLRFAKLKKLQKDFPADRADFCGRINYDLRQSAIPIAIGTAGKKNQYTLKFTSASAYNL